MMMSAWYFATALAKRWDEIIPLSSKKGDKRTHNKTVQKGRGKLPHNPAAKGVFENLKDKMTFQFVFRKSTYLYLKH